MSPNQKEAERKELFDQLSADGVRLSYNEEYDYYNVLDPEVSFQENREMAECLNFGLSLGCPDQEDYIKACREAGVTPGLHEEKVEIKSAYLKKTDGTPVYQNLRAKSVLTNDEIEEFSGTNQDLNPEGAKVFRETARQAIDDMTQAEVNAVNSYTSEYGINYQRVNDYLNGKNPNDVEGKKAAELMTSALDHEIGAPVTAFRGETDLSHISNNPKAKTMLNKVARGDFSSAAKLKAELEGKEITNPTVTSTSLYGAAEGFEKMPVQIIYKVPADAKAVDITAVSAYGGGRSSAASIFGGGATLESELAFKPGMRYKIDRVDYSLTQNGKKQVGQVFITATVLTEKNAQK